MIVKEIREEDFTSYKKPSMVIGFPSCTFKCERECGQKVCQNSALAQTPNIEIDPEKIVAKYLNNPITSAIIMGGLEPFDSLPSLHHLIQKFRQHTQDDIVIYTGYTEVELWEYPYTLTSLQKYPNIIIKFGRFIPNENPRYDELLGVKLASSNQYARRIS